MTQNPGMRLGFIGAGRIVKALARRCHDMRLTVAAVSSRQGESAWQLAAQIEGCHACAGPQEVLAHADLVFLGVPDDALPEIIASLQPAPGQALVHLSGACELLVLEPARERGAQVGAFHPLYLFAGLPEDAKSMAGCTITVEAAQALADTLQSLVLTLECQPLIIPPGQRALYHAGANYAAAFVLGLLDEAATLWQRAGIDTATAHEALWPLLAGTIATARKTGLVGALAGPVSRGDAGIVSRHIAAIEALGADHAELYKALTRRALHLARQREQAASQQQALDAIETLVTMPQDATVK